MKISVVSKINCFFSFWEEVIDVMNEIKYNLMQEVMKKKTPVANYI